ncbi:microsomal glutathione S-transferase 1 isoform X2 [Acinonyx jubatus]|uniref:Microsomal glutathione S-transferase 1 isoform X2 n=1 Tax=Acinonyx jubatus TaxID=32536 RepID=A0ABM3QD54_ACIJB|nr:microsomal glutathione S-transferase 1 isoform X2 [Acinonyx jubatus]
MVDLTELMENEVFMAFASYTTIILSKMMFMSTATAFFRLTRKVFANPEDCAGFGKGENAKKYLRTDDKVERVRRCNYFVWSSTFDVAVEGREFRSLLCHHLGCPFFTHRIFVVVGILLLIY